MPKPTQIHLAAKFVCMYWNHPIVTPQTVVVNSMSASISSLKDSAGLGPNSSPTGRTLPSDQELIAAKISNLPHS